MNLHHIKISSVHIAFARKSLASGMGCRAGGARNSLWISRLESICAISSVGIYRALVQCERGRRPRRM